MQEQLRVFTRALHTPLQQKRQSGGDEIDGQEDQEVESEALKAAGIGAFRVEIPRGQVFKRAEQKHDVDKRRDQRQQNLKNNNVGQRDPAQAAAFADGCAVLPYRLKNAK